MSKVGVFGGTFDPVHLGHLVAAQEAKARLGLERVLFVPNRQSPHKPNQTHVPVEDRVEMVRSAILDNPSFELDLCEVAREGPSYMADTLQLLRDRFESSVELVLLLGLDSAEGFPGWHQPERILSLATLAVLHRPAERPRGADSERALAGLQDLLPRGELRLLHVRGPEIGISSREVRRRIASGEPVRYLLPDPVLAYIRRRGLYLRSS